MDKITESNITIKNAKLKIAELESEIKQKITDFEESTGLFVEDIDLAHMSTNDDKKFILYSVVMDVRV